MPGRMKSIPEIQKELKDRKKQLTKLRAQRRDLQKQIAAVDRKIASISGSGRGKPTGKRKRRRSGKALADYIEDVLKKSGQPMRTKDIADAVKKTGYKSKSKDFYNIVATTLRDDRFKRVARGSYTVA